MFFVFLQMKELGLPLGFLNVSPYELDENNGQVKPVIDPKKGRRRGKKKKKKQVLEEDVIKVAQWFSDVGLDPHYGRYFGYGSGSGSRRTKR